MHCHASRLQCCSIFHVPHQTLFTCNSFLRFTKNDTYERYIGQSLIFCGWTGLYPLWCSRTNEADHCKIDTTCRSTLLLLDINGISSSHRTAYCMECKPSWPSRTRVQIHAILRSRRSSTYSSFLFVVVCIEDQDLAGYSILKSLKLVFPKVPEALTINWLANLANFLIEVYHLSAKSTLFYLQLTLAFLPLSDTSKQDI